MTLPHVQPIAPTWRKEPFDDPDWLFDVKYDGFRALYYIEPGHNRLISRNGNLLTRFDVLAGALAAELNVDDAIIDGEVIAADETGRPQFYDLLGSTRAPACRVRYRLVERCRPAICAAPRAPASPADHPAERIANRFRGAIGHA